MQRSVKLCECVSVSLSERKTVCMLWNQTSIAFKSLCLWFSPQLDSRWPQQDPAPGPVGLSLIILRTNTHSGVCVTRICTNRNEHNYTLVSLQICRQPSTTENDKKNILYLPSQQQGDTCVYQNTVHPHTHTACHEMYIHNVSGSMRQPFSTLKGTVHSN